MRDFTAGFSVDVRLALKDVDVADAVIIARLVDCKHFVYELTVHEDIHVENGYKFWEIL